MFGSPVAKKQKGAIKKSWKDQLVITTYGVMYAIN